MNDNLFYCGMRQASLGLQTLSMRLTVAWEAAARDGMPGAGLPKPWRLMGGAKAGAGASRLVGAEAHRAAAAGVGKTDCERERESTTTYAAMAATASSGTPIPRPMPSASALKDPPEGAAVSGAPAGGGGGIASVATVMPETPYVCAKLDEVMDAVVAALSVVVFVSAWGGT